MLKYTVNINETIDEQTVLNVNTYQVSTIDYDNDDKILVTCIPSSHSDWCQNGEVLSITMDKEIGDEIVDIQSIKTSVKTSNPENGEYSFIAPRYRTIEISSIDEIEDENNIIYWQMKFNNGHLFEDNDEISLIFEYNPYSDGRIILDSVEYVDNKTLLWEVQSGIQNFNILSEIIFNGYGTISNKIKVYRTQTLFSFEYNRDSDLMPIFTVTRPKVHIEVPISEKFDKRLLQQDIINNKFVESEFENSIPNFIEMEKIVYTPVIKIKDEINDITKINFNLHFREHSGENWTVQETDEWNFSKYGSTTDNDNYYSYPKKYESNQSDLLGYLGFTNSDVRNQKNKLQKSFLRLSFYDSPNPTNQQMMAYSTIFFNTNKLYSKYMKCQLLDGWYINEANGSKFDTISTKFELNTKSNSSEMSKIKQDCESVENYRLSSQLSVQDKYSSITSSEGFYLYMWSDSSNVEPRPLYMKVEFNHAGYGRTIPMMAPYFIKDIDGKDGFKTNKDIESDWKTNGYGIMKYNAYSYIKLKYCYDIKSGRYIYYIDPDVYGNIEDNNSILNINLYEARIKF